MLRCIAIDDEPLALELLEDNISKVPFLELVALCSNPIEAMTVMQQQSVDIIFLDIQMPGLTGLQFIQSLQQSLGTARVKKKTANCCCGKQKRKYTGIPFYKCRIQFGKAGDCPNYVD